MNQKTPSVIDLTHQLIEFRDARDWRQFHSLKDLIVSLNLEASELLELTQWKSEVEFEKEAHGEELKQRLREECADVFLYLLLGQVSIFGKWLLRKLRLTIPNIRLKSREVPRLNTINFNG